MKYMFLTLLTGLFLISCITPGKIQMQNESMLMTAGEDWGDATEIARMKKGVLIEGVEALEFTVFFGETTIAWNFSELTPEKPVEISFDVLFDFVKKEGFVEFSWLPGEHTAEAGIWPRKDFSNNVFSKWEDGKGDVKKKTEGWEKVLFTEAKADENGNLTVLMIINHWTEKPEVFYQYMTIPEVRTLE